MDGCADRTHIVRGTGEGLMARVCMIVFNDYVSDARVQREAEALVERGDSVDCICLCREHITSLHGVQLFSLSGTKYRGASRLYLVFHYIQFFCYAFLKVAIEHLRSPYDVVQAHTMPDFLIFAAFVPKLLGAKVVLDMHDLMPEIYMTKYGASPSSWMVRFITWMERRCVSFANRAIAVHKPHLEALAGHGNDRNKFSILLNVPDDRIFKRHAPPPRQDDGTFRLIYHGTLPTRAGLDIAIRAVSRARKEIPHLHFLIIGSGDTRETLAQLAADLDLTKCVEFVPTVPVEKLPALISQSDVGIVPYTADAFTRYVLPTKLLEYAAIGIPAISSRLSTVEAYFDSSMVAFFEPGDDVALAGQILRMYRDPALRQALATSADRFTELYNWPEQRKVYYQLVDLLAPGRPVLVNAKG
jgi:glycosyltransferase involved in cell wall biosynthesis